MEITGLLADEAILAELGKRIARRRISLSLTQAVVAEQAGISKRTLERIESGASAQLSSLIRILRVLELLPGLEQLLPAAAPGPMELLQHKGRARQRAPRRQTTGAAGPWHWDDDD